MTDEDTVRVMTPDREIGKEGSGLSEFTSPLGNFQLTQSSKSSEIDKMIPYVPPLGEVKILQFEDTLSEEDHKNFNLIYESLLLEGKPGNLTDLTLGTVLAKKPLTLLKVMHERLRHLIISSERFKEKKKAEYNAQAGVQQIRKGKGIGKHSKGIRFGRKGKGKRLSNNNNQTKIRSHNTSKNIQTSDSTRGSCIELFCLLNFCTVHVLISVFHCCSTVWVNCSLVVLV